MYSYLDGILTEKTPNTVVVDCNGIGFELKIPLSTFDNLPDMFEKIKLYIYSFHNEEGTRLFGFFTKQEKELFSLLITINRVGPKIALAILSSISIKDLIKAIMTNNSNIIAKTPGLGKKSSERLIIELKDKIEQIADLDIEKTTSSVTFSPDLGLNNEIWSEVETALVSLGYKNFEIRMALQSVKITEKISTQDVVKSCIKHIYLKRNEI